MNQVIEKALCKLLSGRFLSFMMITATLCFAVIKSLNAVLGLDKVDPAIKEVVEKVSMFILGAFVTIATGIYKEYWDQERQPKIQGEKDEKTTVSSTVTTSIGDAGKS